ETALGRGGARVGYSLYRGSLARVPASAENCFTTPCHRCILCTNDIDPCFGTLLLYDRTFRGVDRAPIRPFKDAPAYCGLWVTALRCLTCKRHHLLFGLRF